MEPWISGEVERNNRLRPRNIGAGGTGNSAKIWTPEGPGTHNPILFRVDPVIAFRTAVRDILRSTSLSRYPVRCIGGWSFSTWCIARKTIRYNRSHERGSFLLYRGFRWSYGRAHLSKSSTASRITSGTLSKGGEVGTTSSRFLFRSDNEDAALLLSWKDCSLWSNPWIPGGALISSDSLLQLRWALPVPGVEAGFYK